MVDLNSIEMNGKLNSIAVNYQNEEKTFYKGFIHVIRSNMIKDSLPIIISEDLLKNIEVNSNVHIKGQIRSKDSINEDGKLKVSFYIYIKEIENTLDEDLNIVNLSGYVVKRPNLRTTPAGKQIVDLLIACNYGKDKTAYIPCIAWGRYARLASRLKVGDYTNVCGKFQSRNYTKIIDDISYTKVAYELSIDKFE